ncbi:hypothetical protein Salat_2127500 [Sesamum alatum]|uniref:Uncharacterized protein n=1 Tax=Sesamum alatum TaxID=300844 RepID=A0AAE1Y204_9LAMI|nr:hypothetical protein Salat_2127500 [Sesamum alatum]
MPPKSKASSSGENAPPTPTLISGEAMAIVSSTSSQMLEEPIRKLVAQVALPVDYYWLHTFPSQFANDPPAGYLTVYASQLTSGLLFPLPTPLQQLFNILRIPPTNCFLIRIDVFAPKLTTRECFFYLSPHPGLTFIRDKPSSPGA